MAERKKNGESRTSGKGSVTYKGEPLTLAGEGPDVGEKAPDFTAVGQDLKPVRLSDFAGRPVILASVQSIDTSVCSDETRRFNDEAGRLGDGAQVLMVSMDLPFAQKRWKEEHGVDKVTPVSDYKDHSFADTYGLFIEEQGLLARAVLVLDKDHKVVHKEIVREVTNEPDYDAALQKVRGIGQAAPS